MIPGAFSTSLFVEGSHGEALKKNTLKSLLGTFSLLIPAVIIYIFIIGFGILGVGYAWMVGYGLSSLIVVVMVWKEGWV
jgi:Na+-driven multidrug efflux pump